MQKDQVQNIFPRFSIYQILIWANLSIPVKSSSKAIFLYSTIILKHDSTLLCTWPTYTNTLHPLDTCIKVQSCSLSYVNIIIGNRNINIADHCRAHMNANLSMIIKLRLLHMIQISWKSLILVHSPMLLQIITYSSFLARTTNKHWCGRIGATTQISLQDQ